jgi:beta-glucosidase
MAENGLLAEPLKGEWGFDGVVVSDWTATRSTEAAGRAALDLAMPGPDSLWGDGWSSPCATAGCPSLR